MRALAWVWCGLLAAQPSALESLQATLLRSPDLSARQRAARDLWELGAAARPAVPALLQALRDDSYYGVRENAAHALGLIAEPKPPVISGLLAALTLVIPDDRDGHPFWKMGANQRYYFHVRYAAARALTRLGPEGLKVAIGVLDAEEGHVETSDVLRRVDAAEVKAALERYHRKPR